MKLRLLRLYDILWDSFWFLPAMLAVAAGLGAVTTVSIDHALGDEWSRKVYITWSGSAEGARGVLIAVAGSIMTVVSIVFSMTVSTLSQTSSHFGSRVLRNFTSDRGNQIVLGTFIGTFVYCLLVLRTIRSVDGSSFVPHLSVNVGIILALTSLGVLIYYIHHVSQSIQAENLIADIGCDFQHALTNLFPEQIGEDTESGQAPDKRQWELAWTVLSEDNGYLRRIDEELLMSLATKHDLVFRLEKRPGAFVLKHTPLIKVLPGGPLQNDIEHALKKSFILGRFRTPHQDASYSLQQMVEIAGHALSPGINEPFTALTCIDWLGASIRGIIERDMPSAIRRDKHGNVRVISPPIRFDDIVALSFNQIRYYGASNPDIMVRLLDLIIELAPLVRRPSDLACLANHVGLIEHDSRQIANPADRQRVSEKWSHAVRALNDPFKHGATSGHQLTQAD